MRVSPNLSRITPVDLEIIKKKLAYATYDVLQIEIKPARNHSFHKRTVRKEMLELIEVIENQSVVQTKNPKEVTPTVDTSDWDIKLLLGRSNKLQIVLNEKDGLMVRIPKYIEICDFLANHPSFRLEAEVCYRVLLASASDKEEMKQNTKLWKKFERKLEELSLLAIA